MSDENSLSGIGDQLARRRAELDLGREDQLGAIQRILDIWYPGGVRAQSLHQGVLRLVAGNSSIASELRMRHTELTALGPVIKRIAISVG